MNVFYRRTMARPLARDVSSPLALLIVVLFICTVLVWSVIAEGGYQ